MSENYFPEMLHLALKSPISGKLSRSRLCQFIYLWALSCRLFFHLQYISPKQRTKHQKKKSGKCSPLCIETN